MRLSYHCIRGQSSAASLQISISRSGRLPAVAEIARRGETAEVWYSVVPAPIVGYSDGLTVLTF
jgi:hypothetical protein